MLNLLSNKAVQFTALITAVFSVLTFTWNSGYDKRGSDIQRNHNELVQAQQVKHAADLNNKLNEYKKSLIDAKTENDKYWQDLLVKQKKDLIASIKIEHKVNEIENEILHTDTGCTAISGDALRLFKHATSIVGSTTSSTTPVTRSTTATTD